MLGPPPNPDPRYPYIGRFVVREIGCKNCGYTCYRLETPKGPHNYGVRCRHCGRHGGWLRKNETADLDAYFAETTIPADDQE